MILAFTTYDNGNRQYSIHGLMEYREGRGIALLLVERREHIWPARWDAALRVIDAKPVECPVIQLSEWTYTVGRWTIRFIWVLPQFRRQKIAMRLIEEASRFTGVPIEKLAWYPPFSDEARCLVHQLCPDHFWLGR
jgi:hypothetical protein